MLLLRRTEKLGRLESLTQSRLSSLVAIKGRLKYTILSFSFLSALSTIIASDNENELSDHSNTIMAPINQVAIEQKSSKTERKIVQQRAEPYSRSKPLIQITGQWQPVSHVLSCTPQESRSVSKFILQPLLTNHAGSISSLLVKTVPGTRFFHNPDYSYLFSVSPTQPSHLSLNILSVRPQWQRMPNWNVSRSNGYTTYPPYTLQPSHFSGVPSFFSPKLTSVHPDTDNYISQKPQSTKVVTSIRISSIHTINKDQPHGSNKRPRKEESEETFEEELQERTVKRQRLNEADFGGANTRFFDSESES